MTPARLSHYVASIPTLVRGVRNRAATAAALLNPRRAAPFLVELRDGCRFKLTTAVDLWLLKEVCLDREYERYGPAIRNGWTVVDIGAGLGEFCVSIARRHPDCRVYAFEPGSAPFALLRDNVALNDVGNISLFRSAVGSHAGTSRLHLVPGASALASTAATMGDSLSEEEVPTTTLRELFRDLDIDRCDFLKVDCEGGEYDILMGADAETLNRIAHMSVEYHEDLTPHSGAELAAWLENRGFAVRRIANPSYPNAIGWVFASNRHAS